MLPVTFYQNASPKSQQFRHNKKYFEYTKKPAIQLHPGKLTGVFRLGTDQPVFDENGKNDISVEDLAVAIIDELENNRFIKKRFSLGY
jgi:putative NADH-flavin reductase